MNKCTKDCTTPFKHDDYWDFAVINGIIKAANALQKPCIILDVGANRGTIIENIYKHIYIDKIYAVEASSLNFNNLQKNIASFSRNEHIKLIHAAASDAVGLVDIYSGNGTCETFNIVGDWMSNNQTHITEKVKSVTLDYICEKLNIIFDIIKIDVESAELLVLAGAKKTIDNCACALLECHNEVIFRKVQEIAKNNNWQMLCNKYQHVIDLNDNNTECVGHVFLIPKNSPLRHPLKERTF